MLIQSKIIEVIIIGQDGYSQYKKGQKRKLNQKQLLIMAYKGLLSLGRQSKIDLQKNNLEGANYRLQRMQSLIIELKNNLDLENGGDLANQLNDLYDYMHNKILKANVKKEEKIIDEVLNLINILLDGWEEALK